MLTSLTSYQFARRRQLEDSDGSPVRTIDVQYDNRIRQISQEIRLSSTGSGPWSYVVGGYYEHDGYRNGDYLFIGAGAAPGYYSPFTQKVVALGLFFQYTRIGRALRAVADSHKAALSVGISLNQIWVIVWFTAGIVALITGIMWGARSDVSFALEIVALKALPVLILGGFTSIPGAIVGGLIIGIGEKLGEFYWGPLVGGGIESWLAYFIALGFLLFRPQGLFGDKIIERI